MTTHLGIMVVFVALVSLVFGTLMRDDLGEQVRLTSRIFVSLLVGAYVAGWVLYAAFG
jgi:uncharacterized membrane protein YwzB